LEFGVWRWLPRAILPQSMIAFILYDTPKERQTQNPKRQTVSRPPLNYGIRPLVKSPKIFLSGDNPLKPALGLGFGLNSLVAYENYLQKTGTWCCTVLKNPPSLGRNGKQASG